MSEPPLHFLTIAQASALVAARKLSPVELTQACLDRIAALDDQLDAFVTLTAEHALARARAAEDEIARGGWRGPLHGVPFGLKDVYETAGIRTTAHSKILIDHVPAQSATAARKLDAAGAVLLGKLATHEFASGGPSLDLPWPPARNPWDTAYFTGGSSSGAGAAVAAGFMPFALGTDTGGSIRIPSALCGLAGIKPTYGRVSRFGVIPNSYTFDHCGPLAWTVEDCAIVLQAISGHDSRDPASARRAVPDFRAALSGEVRGLRIGVPHHWWEDEPPAAAPTMAAMEAALDVFRRLGARIGTARLRTRQQYNDVRSVISRSELLGIYDNELRERPNDFSADFIGRNLAACMFTAADIVRAQRERRRMLDELKPLYDEFDVLITPAGTPAPRLDALLGGGFADKWENPNFYATFNLTGAPAMVVCNGYTEDGLPLAMQIAGRPFDEATVLRAGHAYERATSWRQRRPSLQPGAKKCELHEPPPAEPARAIDAEVRQVLDAALRHAGYPLTDGQRRMIARVAPFVLAAARRIPRDQQRGDEPAAIFRFDEA
jgi:aspartyl-tRNA(Asn)/glutamyl-tRNA(Gln) amidotransferase subunit A